MIVSFDTGIDRRRNTSTATADPRYTMNWIRSFHRTDFSPPTKVNNTLATTSSAAAINMPVASTDPVMTIASAIAAR